MKKPQVEVEVTLGEVADYMRLTGRFLPVARKVVERKVTAECARAAGIRVSAAELQKAADIFRLVRGLHKASDTERWFRAVGVSAEVFEQQLETSLLIDKFKQRLDARTNKKKYYQAPGVCITVREMIYRDWLDQALK